MAVEVASAVEAVVAVGWDNRTVTVGYARGFGMVGIAFYCQGMEDFHN